MSAYGPVDERLAQGDEEEEGQVGHDHHAEGVAVPGEVGPGDGQRQADAGVAVEAPVGQGRGEGQGGHRHPQGPGEAASQVGRAALEVHATEGEADDDEALQRDQANSQRRRLAGQQRQEPRHVARGAAPPGGVLPQVAAQVDAVGHPDDGQVDAHQEVGHAQLHDEDVEAELSRGGREAEPNGEGGQVA